jgi:hypothetical protein
MLHNNILRVRDESATGNVLNEFDLSFDRITISIRDVITERVLLEIQRYNTEASEYENYLVQPNDDEVKLNRTKKQSRKRIDADKQIEVAFKAFNSNGFFILIGDYQAESLDELVEINSNPTISFIKLTPLVGG